MKLPPLFPLGVVSIAPEAHATLTADDIALALDRHRCGDFGELDADDCHLNHRAISRGDQVMSVYRCASGKEFWVQTHGSRTHTLILLPEE